MATKTVDLPEIGSVTLYKRKGVRSIRLSIRENKIRITMPHWLPYAAGMEFARQQSAWIAKHKVPPILITQNMQVGKRHVVVFEKVSATKVSSRTVSNRISVKVPNQLNILSPEVQAVASKAAIRVLRSEAEEVLPQRLRQIAATNNFDFKSVEIKRLRSRWGSCNHKKEIVLNSFLMQMPWHLIDYVLLHELTHTRILAHGPKFWHELSLYIDDLPAIRKEIRAYRPLLSSSLNVSDM
jgi:predicted metal-dependent hydrolase